MSGAQPLEPRQIGARTELDGAPMSSTIGFEHPCFGCKYSLKGLSLDSKCPECGKPVTESLRRDLLRFADPAYVQRLKSGAIFVTAATCLPPIGMCIIAPITIFMSAASGHSTTVTTGSGSTTVYTSSASAAPSPVAIALQAVFLLILWVLFSFGWYRLAAPDPQETPGSNVSAGRRTCRRLTVAYAVTAVASTVIPPPELLDPGSVLNAVGQALTLVSLVLFMLLLVYGFRNLKRTANRIPAPGLAKLTGVTF